QQASRLSRRGGRRAARPYARGNETRGRPPCESLSQGGRPRLFVRFLATAQDERKTTPGPLTSATSTGTVIYEEVSGAPGVHLPLAAVDGRTTARRDFA